MQSVGAEPCTAWVGGLEHALPYFSGGRRKCVCHSWSSLAPRKITYRWQPLLESGLRTGEELRQAWATLQERTEQMTLYLEEEVGGIVVASGGCWPG